MTAALHALRVVPGRGPIVDGGRGLMAQQQVLLATWFSPAFPTGGFAYSHGLETAIVDGRLRRADAVEGWISAVLQSGSGWCDAVLFAEAWRATTADDLPRLTEVAALGRATSPSAERHLENSSLGAAFLKAVESGWPATSLERATRAVDGGVTYPVAAGLATAAHDLPMEPAVGLYLNAFVSTLISVAVRLVPLGQTAGLKILAGLQPRILDMAGRAATSSLDDLGSAAMLSDIASMRHETLYSRVFRS